MKKLLTLITPLLALTMACTSEAPPMGEVIGCRDSLPVMTTYGVSKLISDSGVVRYKIITEEWRVYDKTTPQRQYFPKGIYLERYDNNQRTNLHITADTAYCFDQNLWELRGRVLVNDMEKQLVYQSEVLFWDMRKHIFYANQPFVIDEPERHIAGEWFESDEQMKRLEVKNSSGYMPFKDKEKNDSVNTDSVERTEGMGPENRTLRSTQKPVFNKRNDKPQPLFQPKKLRIGNNTNTPPLKPATKKPIKMDKPLRIKSTDIKE